MSEYGIRLFDEKGRISLTHDDLAPKFIKTIIINGRLSQNYSYRIDSNFDVDVPKGAYAAFAVVESYPAEYGSAIPLISLYTTTTDTWAFVMCPPPGQIIRAGLYVFRISWAT